MVSHVWIRKEARKSHIRFLPSVRGATAHYITTYALEPSLPRWHL